VLLKNLILLNFTIIVVVACASSQPLSPQSAQQILADSWQAGQHIIWEIDWPEAPISGSLTVETWRINGQYHYEILEAPTAALVGQVLVFDGQDAWRYNRFEPPSTFTSTTPSLSPVSDAFTIIDRLISTPPQMATLEMAQVNSSPAEKITVIFPNDDTLTLWREVETGLPIRLIFSLNKQQATLKAREFEPLYDPPKELFGVGNWINNIP